MKQLTLLFLIGVFGCTNQNSKQDNKNNSITENKRIENIRNNLVPTHYLKGSENKKSIFQMMEEDKIPGISIAFIDSGRISWQKNYGYANLQDSLLVTKATLFNGASLSKPVTAMAALKLADKNKIDLNEDVNKYLKDWKIPDSKFTEKEKVTLKRLIGHTSGIDNHLWSSYFPGENVPTLIQMLAGEKPSVDPKVSVVYVPGEKRKYSNPGYSVIEKLIEDLTSQNFNAAISNLLFVPSNMNSSTFEQPVPSRIKKLLATGYSSDLKPYPYKLFPYKAAGGIWTTPSDLGKFLIALLEDYHSGKNIILSKETADKVFQKSTERLGFTKIFNGDKQDLLFEHWGSNSGFTSYMVASLNKKQGVVIMTNSDNGTNLMSYIARAVAQEYNWEFLQPTVFEPFELSIEKVEPFVGKFTGGNEVMEFKINDGKFLLTDVANNNLVLIPADENKFILPENNTLYEFLKDKNNNVRYVRVTTSKGYSNDYLRQ